MERYSMNDLARLMAPLARRLGNMVARGAVSAVNAATKMQSLQLRLMAGEAKDAVEHFEPFGFTSKPLPGAEHITLFLDGDRSHGVTIVVADRRYRVVGLEDGESALHDAYGNKVHLRKDGTLAVVATTQVQVTSPLVTMSGNLEVAGSITAGATVTAPNVVGTTNVSFGGKSAISHTHSGVQTGGGSTGAPN
jgi:phage baseplate assembly protein V